LAEDASLEIIDEPFVPPRFEPRRLTERVLANIGAVCIWTVRLRAIERATHAAGCQHAVCALSATLDALRFSLVLSLAEQGIWDQVRALTCRRDMTRESLEVVAPRTRLVLTPARTCHRWT
jgi:hypothetical protein